MRSFLLGVARERPFLEMPHSAFRTPHYSGTAGIHSVTLLAGAPLGCARAERRQKRPRGVEGRAPETWARGRAASDALPAEPGLGHRGAPLPGRAHGDRPDRAPGRPGGVRGGEGAARDGVREPARGGDGGEAAGAGEGGAGVGGPLRAARGRVPLRLHRDSGQHVGASDGRVPAGMAVVPASAYIRVSYKETPNPCRGYSWR